MANASAVNQEAPERSILKVALTALAGSSIEWYDFFIYGTAAALVFPGLFFPGFGDTAGTILSYSTFAVAFVGRPLGGLIFGHFGDKFGRKRALVTALVLMGIGTTTIGLLPGYATLGILAPIILVALRFLQGVCIGGQWGGAVLLATESAPSEKRGFYGSFAQMGVPVAVLISNIIFLIIAATLGDDALVAWAWRIPFLLSVLLIGLGLYIQLKLEDTPAFRHLQEYREQHQSEEERREAEEAAGSPVWEVLRTYPKEIALAAGAFISINANFYLLITYILDYATAEVGLPQSTVLTAVLISSVAGLMAIAGFAALSDVIGRRIPFIGGRRVAWPVGALRLLAARGQREPRRARARAGPGTGLPEHDVRSAGRLLLRDLHDQGPLLGGLDGIPVRLGLRRRARPDHRYLAPGRHRHLFRRRRLHGRGLRHIGHLRVPPRRDLRPQHGRGGRSLPRTRRRRAGAYDVVEA